MALEDEKGVYNLEECPGKPHPHCYCYLTAAGTPTLEELEQALANGDFDTPDNKFSEDPRFNTRLRNKDGISWRPEMSQEEASRWGADSVLKQEFMHGTSPSAANAIREEGFSLDPSRFGRLNGNGVYLTEHDRTAEMYSEGEILRTRVDVKNPVSLDDIFLDPKYFEASDWVDENMPDLTPNQKEIAIIDEYVRREGYDAIMKLKYGVIDELVVLDPRNVVVIKK